MINLLAKLFIKNHSDYDSSSVRIKYGELCGGFGIFLNILLFTGKFYAGLIAKSVAVTADSFNNLADAASSIITLLGFKLSKQKPDTKHPFGHGRIEYIAGFTVSIAILLMGFELLKTSVEKIISPEITDFSWLTTIILVVSILIKLYMYMYNTKIGKRIKSTALAATAKDSLSDCISTCVVLIAGIASFFFKLKIDGPCGLAVALFIIYSGISAVSDAISPLLGSTPDLETIELIEKIILSYPEISGVHDLIVHDYGIGRQIISVHAEVPIKPGSDIFAIHDVIDNAERELAAKLECAATIHLDPVAYDDERVLILKEKLETIISLIDNRLTLHDFRIVPGPSHTNLIFDVVVPFDVSLSFDHIQSEICSAVNDIDYGTYYAIVHFDRPMI